jgi:hypothetical protein
VESTAKKDNWRTTVRLSTTSASKDQTDLFGPASSDSTPSLSLRRSTLTDCLLSFRLTVRKHEYMSVVHAELVKGVTGFWPKEVLLAMDDAGVSDVLAAVTQAAQRGSARLDHGATIHQFHIEPGAADVELHA